MLSQRENYHLPEYHCTQFANFGFTVAEIHLGPFLGSWDELGSNRLRRNQPRNSLEHPHELGAKSGSKLAALQNLALDATIC